MILQNELQTGLKLNTIIFVILQQLFSREHIVIDKI